MGMGADVNVEEGAGPTAPVEVDADPAADMSEKGVFVGRRETG
jgi:hypothetical protein